MQLQTPVEIPNSADKISLKTPILLIGSCFSDEIGKLLQRDKLPVMVNPFGTIFNPISCFDLLKSCLLNQNLPLKSYTQREDLHFNYLLHSDFFALQQTELQEIISQKQQEVKTFFESQTPNYLIITLGTAYVYVLQEKELLVANCHKQPANLFEKRLLNPEEIIQKFAILHQLLPSNTKIILTVSPVRHIKDTLPLNSVSKAILRLTCHELSQQFSNVSYFPSYEIVLDELRDYRFYAPDMLHPTQQTIDYVYKKFCETHFDKNTQIFQQKWHKILQRLTHKSLQAKSLAHKKFLEKLREDLQNITEVEVQKEYKEVLEKLASLEN